MADKRKVVLIGADTVGLAATYTLLKQVDDLDVTALEAADNMHPPVRGGVMHSGVDVAGLYVFPLPVEQLEMDTGHFERGAEAVRRRRPPMRSAKQQDGASSAFRRL